MADTDMRNEQSGIGQSGSASVGAQTQPVAPRDSTQRALRRRDWSGDYTWFDVPIIGLLILSIGALRVGDEPYWMDEAVTALVVRRSLGGLVQVLWDQEAGMTPYYGALWAWSRSFDGDVGLRMFSVVGGATAAALVYLLARRWFDRMTGWMACGLLVANPFFLRYLTEARTYSWLMAIAAASALTVEALLNRPTRSRAVVAGFLIGLGLASHLLFALVPVLLLATAASARRALPRASMSLVAAVAALTFAPSIPALIERRSQLDWLQQQSVDVSVEQIRAYMGGGVYAAVLLLGLVTALGLIVAHRVEPWPTLACAAIAVLVPIAVWAVSFAKPLLVARYLSPAFPFMALGAAVGLAGFARLFGRPVSWLGIAVASVPVVTQAASSPFTDTGRSRSDHDAVTLVMAEAGPGDALIVAHHPPAVLHHLGYTADIDVARLPLGDDSLQVPERPIEEYFADLEAAPTIFVIRWGNWRIHPAITELLVERPVVRQERFGDVTVWGFESAGPSEDD